ncbi:MAG: TIGR03435 family protein, partial [Vicinamibacterales bacterium]
LAGAVLAFAAQADAPAFEVASVKPNADAPLVFSGITAIANGRVSAKAMTVKELIAGAYRVELREIAGGPAWIDSERYDIEARASDAAPEPQLRLMLQALLAERFRVRLHRDTREGLVYALVVAPGGPKMKPFSGECGDGPGLITLYGRLIGKCGSPDTIAASLSRVMDRPVIDRTALTGSFGDIRLDWVPDDAQFPGWGRGLKPVSDPSGASLFTAIQEQLGLRLEAARGPVEIIVIDAVERPAAN